MMSLSPAMIEALNEHLKFEIESMYLYLSMAAYFHDTDYPGFAHWMTIQSQEEWLHAMKFYNYIFERNGRVVLQGIPAPQETWDSPLDAFESVYNHEVLISSRIGKLVDLALQERDHATYNFLQWFVAEQVEEEASALEVVKLLKRVKDSANAMFMLDRQLATRTMPAPAGGDESA
jgi:ferritin